MKEQEFFQRQFNVSCETMEKFRLFEKNLIFWQRKRNLISVNSLKKIWIRHFSDCAQTLPLLDHAFFRRDKKKKKILDVGSGAGLPGVVLALLLKDTNSEDTISLLEANKKKTEFLKEICLDLNLNSEILHNRVEKINIDDYHVIVARAVAPLNKFFDLFKSKPIENISFILPKGKSWREEVSQFKKKWQFNKLVVKNITSIDKSGGVQLLFKDLTRI